MPQLDIMSYLSQINWLFLVLGSILVLVLRSLLPSLKEGYLARSSFEVVPFSMTSYSLPSVSIKEYFVTDSIDLSLIDLSGLSEEVVEMVADWN